MSCCTSRLARSARAHLPCLNAPRWFVVFSTAVLMAAPATAQPATPPDEDALQCAFQRKGHPDYVMWICNPEGSAYARDGLVLWMRTTGAGARVTSRVWSGPAQELVRRSEAIIEAHHASQARCVRYFHVARAAGGSLRWNVAPRSMHAWIESQAKGRLPQLCYAADPGAADLVLVWGGLSDRFPDAFTVDIPWDTDPEASPLRSSGPRDAVTGTAPDPTELKLSVYDVRSGLDDTVIRLGLSIYATESRATPGQRVDWSGALESALTVLAGQPRP